VIMVNDNVRYRGEELPVDFILADFAERAGFECTNIWKLARGKGNSSQQMARFGRRELRKCIYRWDCGGTLPRYCLFSSIPSKRADTEKPEIIEMNDGHPDVHPDGEPMINAGGWNHGDAIDVAPIVIGKSSS